MVPLSLVEDDVLRPRDDDVSLVENAVRRYLLHRLQLEHGILGLLDKSGDCGVVENVIRSNPIAAAELSQLYRVLVISLAARQPSFF